MTQEQIDTMTKMVADLRDSEASLVRDLNCRVLDGTPYVLLGQFKPPGSLPDVDPITMVYGEWEGHGKCFRALAIQPNHFGGVYTMSATSAEKAIVQLTADNDCSLTNLGMKHIRTVKEERLTELCAVIRMCEEALAKAQAGNSMAAGDVDGQSAVEPGTMH